MNAPEQPVSPTEADHRADPQFPTVPGPPVIDSPDAAARALRDLFLANADRGDNAANDELVAELVRRICAQRGSGDCRG
ncbi:MAG: hypothetical protein ACRDSZ_16440 [Pseudonocardiaceae bacterium]